MPIELTYADAAVARIGRRPEALIPILQALQEQYGYLPEEALRRVCETTKITPAALAGVASFYDMFRHAPVGKHLVRVCVGTACHVAGAGRVEDALRRHLKIKPGEDTDADRQFTIEQVACLGCCTLAPVVRIGDTTFGHVTAENAADKVREFLAQQDNAAETKSTEELHPRVASGGHAEIHVGLGSCCMAKGSDQLFHALRDNAVASGADVTVKRVGCVGMCHRTPMIEVATPGKASTFYSDLTPDQARALVQRHFKPRGFVQRASRLWVRVLDGLLTEEPPQQQQVMRFSMTKRDLAVKAFLDRQVHIATEHFGKLDPLDLEEYLGHGGFEALAKCLGAEIRNPKSERHSKPEVQMQNRHQAHQRPAIGYPQSSQARSFPPSSNLDCAGAAGRVSPLARNGGLSASNKGTRSTSFATATKATRVRSWIG